MEKKLNVGDTIKCFDTADMVDYYKVLAVGGIETDFCYEKDGEKGFWLVVTKVPF